MKMAAKRGETPPKQKPYKATKPSKPQEELPPSTFLQTGSFSSGHHQDPPGCRVSKQTLIWDRLPEGEIPQGSGSGAGPRELLTPGESGRQTKKAGEGGRQGAREGGVVRSHLTHPTS